MLEHRQTGESDVSGELRRAPACSVPRLRRGESEGWARTQRTTLEAQHVKAGDTVVCSARGTESRGVKTLRTRARVRRRRRGSQKATTKSRGGGAMAGWLVARGGQEDRDKWQLVEDSRWCQHRGLCSNAREAFCSACLSTRQRPNRSQRRVARQTEKLSARGEQKVHQQRR